jgi:hypothetical protein
MVNTTLLPALPAKAASYFKDGAGTGPGLSNKAGSQNAGTASSGFSSNSGVPAGSGSSGSKTGAASTIQAGVFAVLFVSFIGMTAVLL